MTCDTPTENEIFGEITVDNKSTTSMFLDAINETSPVLDFTVSEDIGTSVPYQIEHNRGEQTDGLDLLRYRVVDKFEHEGYTCFIIIHNTDPECWHPTINDEIGRDLTSQDMSQKMMKSLLNALVALLFKDHLRLHMSFWVDNTSGTVMDFTRCFLPQHLNGGNVIRI